MQGLGSFQRACVVRAAGTALLNPYRRRSVQRPSLPSLRQSHPLPEMPEGPRIPDGWPTPLPSLCQVPHSMGRQGKSRPEAANGTARDRHPERAADRLYPWEESAVAAQADQDQAAVGRPMVEKPPQAQQEWRWAEARRPSSLTVESTWLSVNFPTALRYRLSSNSYRDAMMQERPCLAVLAPFIVTSDLLWAPFPPRCAAVGLDLAPRGSAARPVQSTGPPLWPPPNFARAPATSRALECGVR
jgi:hypothetical protein